VVNTAITGEAVENGFIQLMELKFVVEDAMQKSQSPSGYCPLDAGGFIDRASCQTKSTLIAAY